MSADIERFANEDAKLDDVLFFDFETASRCLSRDDSQFWRRAYAKCLMALLEGTVSRLSQHTVTFYDGVLAESEKKALIGRSGALENAFNAFDLYTNTSGVETPLNRNSEEWLILEKAIRIRNRITHPRSAEELEISDLDLAHLQITARVILDLLCTAHRDAGRALLRK